MKGVQNLRERRNLLGISQIDLAHKLGVSVLSIQFWERGAITPNPDNAGKLEKVLRELEDEQMKKLQARRDKY